MSLYIRRKVQIKAAEDQGLREIVFDIGRDEQRIDAADDLAEGISGSISMVGPFTDTELSMLPGMTSGRALYLRSDKDISIKLNGTGNTPIDIKVPQTGVEAIFYAEIDFTSLHFSYSGTDTLNLAYAIIGK